ncbi:uncharacterized protein [Drosophila tropicalis]|uniref:uncharacterized protein n=1 Tax=Drosophila tropicalis TaxID=46794 RepID=UPI0035ABCF88
MVSFHHTRILRFLLVLIVVILTIFIYASYSTSTAMQATHLHASVSQQLTGNRPASSSSSLSPEQQQPQILNNTGDIADDLTKIVNQKQQPSAAGETHRKSQHRLPTIDEDALLDGGSAGASPQSAAILEQSQNFLDELQYGQNIDGITGNINSSNNNSINNNNSITSEGLASDKQMASAAAAGVGGGAVAVPAAPQQSQSDGEVLIPTSNLQKFIENADKILKNITLANNSSPAAGVGAAVPPVPSTGNEQHTDKNNPVEEIENNLLDGDNQVHQALSSDAVMQVKHEIKEEVGQKLTAAAAAPISPRTTKSKSPAAKAPSVPVDPSKGIATEKIYESGHLDDEIDVERICPQEGEFTKLLVLITSAQSHAEARMSIRQTWGHYGTRRDIGMAFVLGRGTNDTINKALTQENYMYGDLIRGSFIDSYNNLTLKTLSSLEWADRHCSRAKYILKTDDDMFINVPKLLKFLDQHKDKRVIYGRLAKKWKPIRNKKSKYYVSTDQFSASVFPSFTTGPAYVLTSDIVHDLYQRSLQTVYLKLEDVFTTGIVAQSLGIKRVHANEFVNRRISFNPCNIRNAISVHMIKSNEQFDLWKKLLDQTTKCK